jgi:hypothetical protein
MTRYTTQFESLPISARLSLRQGFRPEAHIGFNGNIRAASEMIAIIKTKHFCRNCGWHILMTTGGDVVWPGDLTYIVDLCPRCKGRDLRQVAPSFLEQVNPIESFRSVAYVLRCFFDRRKKS